MLAAGQLSPATVATRTAVLGGMPGKTTTELQNRMYAALTLVLASPCCHHDLQRRLREAGRTPDAVAGVLRHGILRERLGDLLTAQRHVMGGRLHRGQRVLGLTWSAGEHIAPGDRFKALTRNLGHPQPDCGRHSRSDQHRHQHDNGDALSGNVEEHASQAGGDDGGGHSDDRRRRRPMAARHPRQQQHTDGGDHGR